VPPLQVAVIGSGPAGCYLAERLVREAPGCRIDIIDRLPTPYGLVRAGVAPDHQSTKSITRVFDRVLTREGVAFRGNVEIGRDIALDELCDLYDAVVIATGAPQDRRLGIPGEDLAGIVGSGAFVGWYNSNPDHCASSELAADLACVRSAVLIGNGNVALDVARILAKSPDELAQSDMDPAVERALAAAPLTAIHICGRRGPADAGFSSQELGELGELARARPIVDVADLPPSEGAPNPAIIACLRDFATRPASDKPIAIHFHFHARPVDFTGSGRVAAARFIRPDGAELVAAADLVVTCIGYQAVACGTLASEGGVFANLDGRIAPGLYVVGWAKRGPSGTIATNRAESHEVARRLAAEVTPSDRPGGTALTGLLAERGARPVDYAGWLRIDAVERARAMPGRPRHKLGDRDGLLAHAS
jgi:pyridine nucleotide-disulfide oxidoreductase